ncbi:DNA-directed RNA polymerase I subunit RPA1 [Chelonus insularis]|uniref:DNA-directed RNA polymerase I subunit RPA1 n=1 Tax=Chelonus insularis TaxID=460826 RepID=UPI00158D8E40|nr:DNA-directed RNA polymerase I subunit RPA1 [Chelonus insularis]
MSVRFVEIPVKNIPKHLDPKSLIFSVFTVDDIRKLSVVQVCTPLSFNVLGHPLKGGLYDPALGPLDAQSDPCGTCGENVYHCTGHFGHIELPVPVVNPLFHKTLCTLIKLSCMKCFTLQIPDHIKLLLSAKLRMLHEGFYSDLETLDHEVNSILSQNQNLNEAEVEYIREIIENHIETLRRTKSEVGEKKIMSSLAQSTKNINIQWHIYVENVLKQCSAGKFCINCHNTILKVTVLKNKIMISKVLVSNNLSAAAKTETVLLMPDQSREYMRSLWKHDKEILKVIIPCLSSLDLQFPTDVFFFDVVPVLPPIVRPTNVLNGQIIEHPQSQIYKAIIQDCFIIRTIIQAIKDGDTSQLSEESIQVYQQIRGTNSLEKLHLAWQALQANADHLMDREMSKTSESANCQGLKQIIEKKEGIIRMHMMGKRVNYAARSVITPDPNLNIDEIGIPEAFALKLTYPVAVTPWNVTELRQMIINGPDKHPGAVMIEGDDGRIRRIDPTDVVNREAIAKRLLTTGKDNSFHAVKIVHRHLQNGDILLLNRQPTLHKPSIMAHKARILKGEKTLRLHYSNCKAYNADFDGDEMNAHFPQNELARSEGYNIANVSNQYLVPKDGTPLGGLIQDHMISGVKLTCRGRFFSKADYMQLVYSGLNDHFGDIILLPPTIIKPIQLWSGKQVISTVIINTTPKNRARINLTAGAKISDKNWVTQKPRRWKCGEEFTDPKTMSEAEVIIRHGELLCGVLDKTHYGATSYGLIHCVFELYGGACSTKMLSSFGKLFQAFLQRSGFTLGIEDILIVEKNDAKRDEIIQNCRKIGDDVQKSAVELPEDTPREVVLRKMEEETWKNKKFRALIDRKYKNALDPFTNDINKTCLPAGLLKKFPKNNLQLMVQSGAKGSTVNTMQISCLLGQIELEGKRPPLMISGRSLPSFPPYDSSPRAGGFIDGRFMTGIQPQEFFFHCMAGREGLIDTAVKTSRSGYLQRCLIKHLEGLTINYDLTVRDSDGSLIQVYYGEDGLDIPKSRFLKKEQMDFLVENKNAIIDKTLLDRLKSDDEKSRKEILKNVKALKKFKETYGNLFPKTRTSPFAKFSQDNFNNNSNKSKIIDPNSGRSKAVLSLMRKWIRADKETKATYKSGIIRFPDPIIAKHRLDLEFGVLTEKLEDLVDEYMIKRDGCVTTKIKIKELRDLMSLKVMKTLCPPGEPVGLLAAQSIGEPSTQMTLNTFHFAGRGEMNVTLGIPRLREILMMASKNIKTPSMEIPFKKTLPNLPKQANKLKLKLTRCVLSDVLQSITINRKLEKMPHRQLEYTLLINFLPHKYYKHEFCVTSKQVIEKTELLFFKEVFKEIKKVAKLSGTSLYVEEERKVNDKLENSMLDAGGNDFDFNEFKNNKVKADIGEMHESSDEEEIAEDADATAARSVSRHQENQEYDDPEEEEAPEEPSNDIDETEISLKIENDLSDDEVISKLTVAAKMAAEQRKNDVTNMYTYGIDYDFDAERFRWCKFTFWLPLKMIKIDLPTILRTAASKVVLWETPAIRRAFTFQNSDGDTVLKTDGLNIVEMFKYNEILDLTKLYSNDIYGISQTYGIEAANRVIVKEVKDVFKMYGITVDSRHLSLVADYMTFDGTFQPLSRKGMEDSASPLQQMSFESSLTFLKSATLQGKRDDLLSPSSRLMLGQPCRTGTGFFGVYFKPQLSMFNSNSSSLKV